MSFGFSIGDFLTAIELANRIRARFVDAPDQFRAISEEVKRLSNVLRDIDDVLPQRDLSGQQTTELDELVKGCRDVLNQLQDTLEKYQELDPSIKGFGARSRRVWKRLKWNEEEIEWSRSRITLNITLFDSFLGRITSRISSATKERVDQLHARQDKREDREEYQAILDWLTPIDYAPQQSDFIARRQRGTGRWLTDSDKFQAWVSQTKQTLFCQGMPGAGKTILTSHVVDHMEAKFQNEASTAIAYLYCNFRRQHEQKPSNLLESILKQLVQKQSTVPESVRSLYSRHKIKRTRPLVEEISKVLHSVVSNYSRCFIIVDALDECQISDGGRKQFLSEIFDLQIQTGINLFTTSRFIPDIEKHFEGSISLEIRASDEDVGKYVDGHMARLPLFVSRSPDLQDKIKTEIIMAVDGMFLLAQLHLDSLTGKRSPKAIRSALQQLPKGLKALDSAYKEAMERIESQVTDSQELAKQVLSWITCARRPLTTTELQHALAVEIGEFELDQENLSEVEDIVSVCAGLVTVDKESDIIRLVHYTTQEYFQRTQDFWLPDAQRDIARSCVTYLLFNAFETGYCQTDDEFEARLRFNILYDYASRNWGHHARAASTEAERLTMDLLKNEANLSASSQAMIASKKYPSDSGYSRTARHMTGVHVAAYFGLREAITAMLNCTQDPDSENEHGRTPLSFAAEQGHTAVVRQLLATDGVNADSHDECGRTPLSWAAGRGYESVVQLLLATDGVDVNSETRDKLETRPKRMMTLQAIKGLGIPLAALPGRTPLSFAAANGHEPVVQLLLAKEGIDINLRDTEYGRTPLSFAAANGHKLVVQLLLAKEGIDINLRDTEYGRTPLSFAAANGHEPVVQLLLAKERIDINLRDTISGQTALSLAAMNGHVPVVRLLLAKEGIDVDKATEYGRTPLSFAAERGHEAVVKLLLDKGVDPDSKDYTYGRTPLSFTAINGHAAVVKLLLKKSVDLNSKDNTLGLTPLSIAALNGDSAVLKLLLARDDIDPDSKDNTLGLTPLSIAASSGHSAVVELLLARDDIDPDSKDIIHGQTPLSLAAASGHSAVVELLLARDDIDPDSKDNDGRTPLLWAACYGFEDIVKMLLARNSINVDSKDRYGRTPLIGAAVRAQQAVVKLLLKTIGVDPVSKDVFGRTALSEAARRGNVDIVKLLIEKCKENGMEIHGEYGDSAPQPAADPQAWMSCSVCLATIPNASSHHHCGICSNGDFDICKECITSGAFCLNHSHKLVKRTVKDGELVEVAA